MNNTLGPRALITLEYKEKLEQELNIEVILYDERLTSVISNNVLIDADISRKKRKKKVDGMTSANRMRITGCTGISIIYMARVSTQIPARIAQSFAENSL
mgnify:CR=1 FL=1